ncbi:hypothetical protein HYPSUDRAFT_55211 [Hypholoma sublateritium FD-334 SS-4]|uniref:Uncharacterized protein n=1 Tax=Hypholoma sublateritium (strain FD-334 SS-4) TaxID=945553 RepID=A0A0D2PPQ9_HYPSF|nr:hypothetical protein HYPSUDRAFT_55211 [Hypholoma sublateritium FD-334 SS-4]
MWGQVDGNHGCSELDEMKPRPGAQFRSNSDRSIQTWITSDYLKESILLTSLFSWSWQIEISEKYQPHAFSALRTNMPTSFDYARGSAFVDNGRLYYSPNCSRPVVIPLRGPFSESTSPFTRRRLAFSDFLQPVWWSQSWSWLSFVPLQPTYTSFPFEPLTWMPPVVLVQVAISNSSGEQEIKEMFKMQEDVAFTWLEREQLLVSAANKIRLKHGISSTTPPLPSSFGFARAHKSHALAKQMISISRDWFGVLMGWLASIIAEVSISKHQRVHPENLPVPYWYWFLSVEGMPHHWLDGLRFSPVGLVGHDTLRAGIIFSWAEYQHGRPPIDFFYDHSIPIFFPWSIKEEQLIGRDSSLSYLRPPNELIQNALSFLSKSPQSLPLAAFTMKCFFRADYDGPLQKETLRVLDARSASSFVLKIMKDLFLSQYTTLTEFTAVPEAMDQLADAMAAIPEDQRRAAEAAASVPQQIMLPKELQPIGVSNGVLLDWKDFFISRAKRHKEKLLSASDLYKEAIENRRRQPPTKKTKMFAWEIIKTPGALTLYRRNQITRSAFEDILDDNDVHIYDPIINEWDFFPGFVKDPEGQVEDGVPALRLAPPVVYRHYYDDDDSDDSSNNEENHLVDSGPVAPHSLPSSRSAHQAATADEEGELVEDDPDVSCDLEETLCFMYGWKRTHGYEMLPELTKSLDWRGVEKILGFSSTPAAQEIEKLAITSFVTILAMGPLFSQKLSVNLDDLNSKNRDPLCLSFDFRNILRLTDGIFIFHSLPSEACNWLLAVRSPEIVLYIARLLVSYPRHTNVTLARHLLERGIGMYTLLHLRSNTLEVPISAVPQHPFNSQCSFREYGYHFSSLDFQSYTYRCRQLLGEIGRSALLQGGILARIAREFISIETALDGPSRRVFINGTGVSFQSETNGYKYWDDEISQTEIDIICGTYLLPAVQMGQIKVVSWFPPPSVWAANGFAWLEWTEASENLFKDILRKIWANKFQPLSKVDWRKKLRGFGGTRKLLEANAHRSVEFLSSHCSVRQTI